MTAHAVRHGAIALALISAMYTLARGAFTRRVVRAEAIHGNVSRAGSRYKMSGDHEGVVGDGMGAPEVASVL